MATPMELANRFRLHELLGDASPGFILTNDEFKLIAKSLRDLDMYKKHFDAAIDAQIKHLLGADACGNA